MLVLPCIGVGSEIGFMLARCLYSQPEQAIDQRSAASNKVLQGVRIGNAHSVTCILRRDVQFVR
jgi:hypothetical protein